MSDARPQVYCDGRIDITSPTKQSKYAALKQNVIKLAEITSQDNISTCDAQRRHYNT